MASIETMVDSNKASTRKSFRQSLSLSGAGTSGSETNSNIEEITNIIGFINEEFKCVHNNFSGILYVGPLAIVFLGRIFFFEWTVVIKWEDVVHVKKLEDGVSVEVRAPKPCVYEFDHVFNPEKVWSTLVSLHNDSIIDMPNGGSGGPLSYKRRSPTPRQLSQTFRRRNSDPASIVSNIFDFTEPPSTHTGDIFSPKQSTTATTATKRSSILVNKHNIPGRAVSEIPPTARSGSAPTSPNFVNPQSSTPSSATSASSSSSNKPSLNSALLSISFENDTSSSNNNNMTQKEMDQIIEKEWSAVLNDTSSSCTETAIEGQELSCGLKDFLDNFVKDDATYPIHQFMTGNGDEEIDCTSWKKEKFGTAGMTRTIEYTHPVNAPMAPPKARARKEQTLKTYGKFGFIIKTKTFVADVPMTDCFYVEDLIRVKAVSGSKVEISINFGLTFVKSTMFRSIIQRTTKGEFHGFMENYINFLVDSLGASSDTTAAATTPSEQQQHNSIKLQSSHRASMKTMTTAPSNTAIGPIAILLCVLLLAFQALMLMEMRAMRADIQKLRDEVVMSTPQSSTKTSADVFGTGTQQQNCVSTSQSS